MAWAIELTLRDSEEDRGISSGSRLIALAHLTAQGERYMLDFLDLVPANGGRHNPLGFRVRLISSEGHIQRMLGKTAELGENAPFLVSAPPREHDMVSSTIRVTLKGASAQRRCQRRKDAGKNTSEGHLIIQKNDKWPFVRMYSKTSNQFFDLVLKKLDTPSATRRGCYGV